MSGAAGERARTSWQGGGPPRRRDALLPAGVASIGIGVALTIWTGLGAGPVDVLLAALAQRAGGSFTAVVAPTLAVLALLAVALGGRPGAGTLIAPLAVGPTIDAALWTLNHHTPPDHLVALTLIHLCATGLLGAGGAAILLARRGPAVLELLGGAIALRARTSEVTSRTALEGAMLGAGWALGGPVGYGTVIVALGSGPAVRLTEKLANRAGLTR